MPIFERRQIQAFNLDALDDEVLDETSGPSIFERFKSKNRRVLKLFDDIDEIPNPDQSYGLRLVSRTENVGDDIEDEQLVETPLSHQSHQKEKNRTRLTVRNLSPIEIVTLSPEVVNESPQDRENQSTSQKSQLKKMSLARKALISSTPLAKNGGTIISSTPFGKNVVADHFRDTAIWSPVKPNGIDTSFIPQKNDPPKETSTIVPPKGTPLKSLAAIEEDLNRQYDIEQEMAALRTTSTRSVRSRSRQTSVHTQQRPPSFLETPTKNPVSTPHSTHHETPHMANGSAKENFNKMLYKDCTVHLSRMEIDGFGKEVNSLSMVNMQRKLQNITDANPSRMVETPIYARIATAKKAIPNSSPVAEVDLTDDESKNDSSAASQSKLIKTHPEVIAKENTPQNQASDRVLQRNKRARSQEASESLSKVDPRRELSYAKVSSDIIKSFRTLTRTGSSELTVRAPEDTSVLPPRKKSRAQEINPSTKKYFDITEKKKKGAREKSKALTSKKSLYSQDHDDSIPTTAPLEKATERRRRQERAKTVETEVNPKPSKPSKQSKKRAENVEPEAENEVNPKPSKPSKQRKKRAETVEPEAEIEVVPKPSKPSKQRKKRTENVEPEAEIEVVPKPSKPTMRRKESSRKRVKTSKREHIRYAEIAENVTAEIAENVTAEKEALSRKAKNYKQGEKRHESEDESSEEEENSENAKGRDRSVNNIKYDPYKRGCQRLGLRVRRYAKPFWINNGQEVSYGVTFDRLHLKEELKKTRKKAPLSTVENHVEFKLPNHKVINLKSEKEIQSKKKPGRPKKQVPSSEAANEITKTVNVDATSTYSTSNHSSLASLFQTLNSRHTKVPAVSNVFYDLASIDSLVFRDCGNGCYFASYIDNKADGIIKLLPGGFKQPAKSRYSILKFNVLQGKVDVKIADENVVIEDLGYMEVKMNVSYELRNNSDREAYVVFTRFERHDASSKIT